MVSNSIELPPESLSVVITFLAKIAADWKPAARKEHLCLPACFSARDRIDAGLSVQVTRWLLKTGWPLPGPKGKTLVFVNPKLVSLSQAFTPGQSIMDSLSTSGSDSPNLPPAEIRSREHEIDIRVRYQETDAQGRVHHATYINYFEIGRVEFLRANGYSYRQLEADGIQLVVTEIHCQYFQGAKYDDLLRLKTRLIKARGVRITHEYELYLGDEEIVRGKSVVACVAPDGSIQRLPKWLRWEPSGSSSR